MLLLNIKKLYIYIYIDIHIYIYIKDAVFKVVSKDCFLLSPRSPKQSLSRICESEIVIYIRTSKLFFKDDNVTELLCNIGNKNVLC